MINSGREWDWMDNFKKNNSVFKDTKIYTMKPIGKYILIKKVKESVKTDSGLMLSGKDVSDIRYKKGVVSKPGTDVDKIVENDVIYYDSRAGYTMVIKGEQFTVITERDVVVVE